MSLTSDPHAWLRAFYVRLQCHPRFTGLTPLEQFEELCDAVGLEYPTEAAKLAEWLPGPRQRLMTHLAESVAADPAAVAVSELWRLTKGDRLLRCVVQYLPSGIDLRLMEGSGFRRTQLCSDVPGVEHLSHEWRQDLLDRGWLDAT